MSKLTSKERNSLPDEIFGLKEGRKYPLHDKEHVLKAIQFFRFCNKKDRSELAKNINGQAKRFGMRLNIDKNSLFYKYADRKIVTESYYEDHVERGIFEINKLIRDIEGVVGYQLDREINYFFDNASPQSLFTLEQNLVTHMSTKDFVKKYLEGPRDKQITNPYTEINNIMSKVYKLFFDFAGYYYGGGLMKNTRLFYSIVEDINFIIKRLTLSELNQFDKYIAILRDIIANYNCNKFMIIRYLLELQYYYTININNRENPDNRDSTKEIFDKITKFIYECKTQFPQTAVTIYTSNKPISANLFSTNVNLINITETLKLMNMEIKNDIHNMILSRSINFVESVDVRETYRFMGSLNDIEDARFLNVLGCLDNELRPDNVRRFHRNWSTTLNSNHIAFFSELDFGRLFAGHDCLGNNIFFCVKGDSLYLVLSDIEREDCLYIILLYKAYSEFHHLITNLICSPDNFDKSVKAKYFKFEGNTQSQFSSIELLTEGITFDKDGGIKFSFKPSKSYMDEYAENHKLLLANHKSGNYEAMKTNLAFLFALINTIERDVIHSKKAVSEEIKKDAMKARAFAMNDFKTYIKELQKQDPGFNFTSYYENSDYGKLTINFTNDEVVGIKRLFRTIMFS